MKRLVLKGFLLYFTAFFIMINILSIDMIMEEAGFIVIVFAFIASAILVCMCKMGITKEEFYILSLQKWADEWLKKTSND